ncbi:MAG: NAD-dependent epimerase/dehydratase family protein [Clostridia bacterium]|nr:NAD-dependent epimerase/dehydratase family protein [Clostridia bacterium]
MKALFIGGTGTISSGIVKQLAQNPEWEVILVNRGNRMERVPEGVRVIQADANNEAELAAKLEGMTFDCVCEFIGFRQEQVERDWRIFRGRTKQYMYISSASAYQKPPRNHVITESTPLCNPYWQYSRDKIACEDFLMRKYREEGFPVTVVRPSHTYDERFLPLDVTGDKGFWSVVKRMIEGKPVIMHGDGTSLWTVTHNSDFAKGFIGLMGNVHAIGETFQITSDESVTWNQIYQTIADCLEVPFRPYYVASSFLHDAGRYDFNGGLVGDKANSVVFDCSKIKKVVPGFCCTVRMDQGIRRSLENILAHPELQREDPEFDQWCDRVIAALEKAKAEILQG